MSLFSVCANVNSQFLLWLQGGFEDKRTFMLHVILDCLGLLQDFGHLSPSLVERIFITSVGYRPGIVSPQPCHSLHNCP